MDQRASGNRDQGNARLSLMGPSQTQDGDMRHSSRSCRLRRRGARQRYEPEAMAPATIRSRCHGFQCGTASHPPLAAVSRCSRQL